jgi:teichuronic acid biosynthesis glycosyltransferase TuaC
MRILLVTPFYPPDFGGISDHVAKLATLLSEKHEVKIVANTRNNFNTASESDIIRIPSITPPPFPYQTLTSLRIPLKVKPLSGIIKEFQPDIIHAHGHHYPITWISAQIAKSKNIPFIVTLHGLYALTTEPTLVEEIFNQTIFKWLLHVADSVIALTPTMASYVKKYGNAQCYIIPNGVDLDVFLKNLNKKLEYRRKYDLSEDKIIILYRGRFVYVKGFLELILAINELNRNENFASKVLFLLIGNGPLREEAVKKLAKYDNCKIMSWTPRSLIHELYIASDIFILPSKWHEAFPLVTLEAMAAGLYIVASTRGCLQDILEGYKRKKYLETVSVKEIVKVLTQVVSDWHEKENIRDKYIEKFDWGKIANEIQKIYKNLTENTGT